MAKDKTVRVKNLVGITVLLITTILWGTAFSVLKTTINALPPFYVLAIRFLPSGLIMGLVFIKQFKHIDRRTVLHGAVLGVVLFCAYTTQTLGLRYTTPARNAFITVAYCIMTPFLCWIMYKHRPRSYDVISGVVCMLGLAFISLIGQGDDGGLYLLGDGLTLVAALFFAFQLVFIERYIAEGNNPYLLLFFELTIGGFLFAVATACYELPTLGAQAFAIPHDLWWRLLYLMLGCSMLAQLFQMLGQRFTTSSQAGIILSFESVFAAITSVALGMESLTVYLIVGFVLVFVAGLISQLHLDPVAIIRRLRRGTEIAPADTQQSDAETPDASCPVAPEDDSASVADTPPDEED